MLVLMEVVGVEDDARTVATVEEEESRAADVGLFEGLVGGC